MGAFLVPLLMAAGGAGIGALTSKKGHRLQGALKGAGIGAGAGMGMGGLGAAAGTGGAAAAGSAAAAAGHPFLSILGKYGLNRLQHIGSGDSDTQQSLPPIQMPMSMPLSSMQPIQPALGQSASMQSPDDPFLKMLIQRRLG